MTSQFKDKSVLITGGTGSFGKHMTKTLLNETDVRRVIVFSRDELKQFEMQQEYAGENRLRFFIGNVRERDRLLRAFDGVDLVIHAAALKQVPAAEYNPFEAIKTNILGASNVIDAAIDRGIKKVVALSTDKASSPINLYGATKLVSDKLFVSGNAYAGKRRTRFAVVRYGNVVGSRGSVVPLFRTLAAKGVIPITDDRMTRFWITLDQGVRFVINAFSEMQGGEVFVPKIPSMKVVDLAKAMAPNAKINIVGIRPGEKLHEEMISETDARRTLDVGDHYVIQPEFEWWNSAKIEGKELPEGFRYSSDNNDDWLDIPRLQAMVNG
jgi:UDP-N-acetylglucosamine 4,6-dehydratase